MATEKIRTCDTCGKRVDPYKVGAVTLFNEIRIGRGGNYKAYNSDSPCFKQHIVSHNDYDAFGSYSFDKQSEISFCGIKCCAEFIDTAYKDMYDVNIKGFKNKSFEIDNITFDEYKKNIETSWFSQFISKIKPNNLYKAKIKEFDTLISDIEEAKERYTKKMKKMGVKTK